MRPDFLAGLRVEAVDALDLFGIDEAVGDENETLPDGRSAVAAADRGTPDRFKLRFAELGCEAGFGPDSITVGSAPLRPLFSLNEVACGDEQEAKETGQVRCFFPEKIGAFCVHGLEYTVP